MLSSATTTTLPGYSRRRIWIDAAQQRFGSFVELNAWLGDHCRALWDGVRHPEHDQFSVAEMLDNASGLT